MEVYVGTSGWAYAWNRGGSLAWFVEQSGLNAIEVNYPAPKGGASCFMDNTCITEM